MSECFYCKARIMIRYGAGRPFAYNPDGTPHRKTCPELRRLKRLRQRERRRTCGG